MDYKVVWTDDALDDLERVVTYIARDDPTAAERTGYDIIDHVETLKEFLLSGLLILKVHAAIDVRSCAANIEFFTGCLKLVEWLRF